MFNRAPQEIPIPSRVKLQNFIFAIGAILGLIALFSYLGSNFGGMFVFGLLSIGVFVIGGKIKTTKKAIGQSTIYR